MIFGIECFSWAFHQGIRGILEKEKIEGTKAISNFGGGNLQGTMLCRVEQKRALACWKMVDTFMAQKIIVKTLTHLV